jgi:hypothetical protein
MFLTPSELEHLTGYRIQAKQIEWLRKNGVPHYVNALGRPVVTKEALYGRPLSRFDLGTVR